MPCPSRHHRQASCRLRGRRGFTLVEMLISVTLVLIMMLMFAEVFRLAGNTIATQKGIAENDQKARILANLLRKDLENRTFKTVMPFLPGDSGVTASDREGYFSISENHPDLDDDDVLQLTIRTNDGSRIYGGAIPSPSKALPTGWTTGASGNDHPEFDDGIGGNGSSSSDAAEIAYFLRNGNLYRTSLLIRSPHAASPGGPPNPGGAGSTPNTPNFWQDFDFSAFRDGPNTLQFHGPNSLSNIPGAPTTKIMLSATSDVQLPLGLGSPQVRFGNAFSLDGRPREYLDERPSVTTEPGIFANVTGATPKVGFLGRYTAEERSATVATSTTAFSFPGVDRLPLDPTVVKADADNDGVVDGFEKGSRRGTDLLMSNVHGFDVEVWDDVVGDFVDLGHSRKGTNPFTGTVNQDGLYSAARHTSRFIANDMNWQNYFAEAVTQNVTDFGNRFDTWHHEISILNSGVVAGPGGPPPYLPTQQNQGTGGSFPFLGAPPLNTIFNDPGVEAPLRAIRITVRYLDVASGQMRRVTIEESLVN